MRKEEEEARERPVNAATRFKLMALALGGRGKSNKIDEPFRSRELVNWERKWIWGEGGNANLILRWNLHPGSPRVLGLVIIHLSMEEVKDLKTCS